MFPAQAAGGPARSTMTFSLITSRRRLNRFTPKGCRCRRAGEPTAGEQPSGGDRPRTYLPSVTGTVTLYRANTSRWSAMRRRRPRGSLAAAMAAVSASSLSAVLLATPSAQAVSAQALSFARAASGGPTGISAVAGELVNARTGKDMWARQEIEVVFLAGGASRSVAAASWMVN
jgi:hypothetical protein